MRISDWSSDVCSSDLDRGRRRGDRARGIPPGRRQALGHHHFRDPDGALMELKELRGKSADELKAHMVELQKEQFSLRMQKATGQLAKTHDVRRVRREIARVNRSEEHTSELQSLMRISYAVFCLKKKKQQKRTTTEHEKYVVMRCKGRE